MLTIHVYLVLKLKMSGALSQPFICLNGVDRGNLYFLKQTGM